MIKEGYSLKSDLFWADVAQYFRECNVCGDYVDVDDQSENVRDKCDSADHNFLSCLSCV